MRPTPHSGGNRTRRYDAPPHPQNTLYFDRRYLLVRVRPCPSSLQNTRHFGQYHHQSNQKLFILSVFWFSIQGDTLFCIRWIIEKALSNLGGVFLKKP